LSQPKKIGGRTKESASGWKKGQKPIIWRVEKLGQGNPPNPKRKGGRASNQTDSRVQPLPWRLSQGGNKQGLGEGEGGNTGRPAKLRPKKKENYEAVFWAPTHTKIGEKGLEAVGASTKIMNREEGAQERGKRVW